MAYSSAALTAQEIADFALDYPILGGKTAGDSLSDARWNTSGSLANADVSATGFAASKAFDRRGNEITKPNTTGTVWYLMLDAGAAPADVDFAVIIGHNFSSVGVTEVLLQVADDNAFTSNLVTVATWVAGFTARLASFSLFHTGAAALRYTLGRYWRLKITMASGTPQVGELWLGRRRQMSTRALMGFDSSEEEARVADFTADDGSTIRYKLSAGQRVVDASFIIATAGEVTTLDSWYTECDRLTEPTIYCEAPSSAPTYSHLMLGEARWKRSTFSGAKRRWSPTFREADSFRSADA